jgi:lysine-specific demethylase/histidyl-hydroxylase NO66
VGANVYLTPKNSQGFAPHWDDIEAFVLQLEGKKRWRVYEPLEKLPKASSANLTDDVIGKSVLDVTLEPGDMLYFPRGFIHQANATDEHSLHITISCYQNTSYSDFLKEYLPMALDHATMESVAHREGLPRDYLQYMGVAHADREDLKDKRAAFIQKIKKLTTAIIDDTIMDFTADQMGKKVIWDSLPPFLDKSELRTTVSSAVNYTMANGAVTVGNDLDMEKDVRLLRQNCVRLVIEDGVLRLYYSTENSLEYHGEEVQFLEMVEDAGPLVEFLIAQYPRYVKIKDLPSTDDDDDLKLQIVSDLWEKGILRTKG